MKTFYLILIWLAALFADISYRLNKYQPKTREDRSAIVREAVWCAKNNQHAP